MEIRLIKDWNRKGVIHKKGKVIEVTNELGRSMIKEKRAKSVKDALPFISKLVNKKVSDDGTKQTAKKKEDK